ncbi:MAG: hypothetical protein QNJ47_16625 [Nostocaceae cyanobacterium]|nr:hypothetical protein [Nostocaceae cyanobacterium]
MTTFILACGYLLTVYLLLAVVKHSFKKHATTNIPLTAQGKPLQDISVTPQLTDVVGTQESALNTQ